MSSNAETVRLVIGTSRGTGLEMTRQLLQSPATMMFATCRSPPTADALQAPTASAGARLHMLRLDVNDVQSVKDAGREAAQIVGEKGVDYLVNNAGITADLKAIFATNRVGRPHMGGAGEGALPVSVGVRGVIKVITSLTPKDSGTYLNFKGEHVPW